MAKKESKTIYICDRCGQESVRWLGKCPGCGEWNTFVEQVKEPEAVARAKPSIGSSAPPQRLKSIESSDVDRFSSGISEFDRVLGSGITRDGLIALSAQPGAGKSTLLLMLSNNVGHAGMTVLYISGEESERQIKARADRLFDGDISDNVLVKSETCMDRIKDYIRAIDPQLIIIDSIQTVYLEANLPSRAGGAVQVMACTDELMAIAKKEKRAVFLVGQVTKEDELAGVRALEHAVDAVIYLEGDRKQQLRIARAIKNRFGSTDEIGIFQMEERGLIPIENTLDFFTTQRKEMPVGCALTVSMEGTRPLIIEIESLADKTAYGTPARIGEGVNKQQLQVLTAVLENRAGLALGNRDVYVKVSGGMRLTEPAVNLGILVAIASSFKNKPMPSKTAFIGEVGLTGEIKSVQQVGKRLRELDRWGFETVYVPKDSVKGSEKFERLQVIEVETVREVIAKVIA